MPAEVSVPGNALVIRFRPTTVEAVQKSALNEYRRDDHYGCSVFADAAKDGESEADVIARLSAVAELDHMGIDNHPKLYVCAEARNLQDQGFVFMKDGYAGELAEHYCVNLGVSEPDVEVVRRFLEQFDRTERR